MAIVFIFAELEVANDVSSADCGEINIRGIECHED
jgi:hypothetical protein